jgi:hypothetical protein
VILPGRPQVTLHAKLVQMQVRKHECDLASGQVAGGLQQIFDEEVRKHECDLARATARVAPTIIYK